MAWGSIFTQSKVGPNKTDWQLLNPNEGMQIHFKRTAGTGDVVLNLWASIDGGTTVPEVPLFSFTMDADDDEATIPVSGPLFSVACSSASGTFEYKFRPNGGLVL